MLQFLVALALNTWHFETWDPSDIWSENQIKVNNCDVRAVLHSCNVSCIWRNFANICFIALNWCNFWKALVRTLLWGLSIGAEKFICAANCAKWHRTGNVPKWQRTNKSLTVVLGTTSANSIAQWASPNPSGLQKTATARHCQIIFVKSVQICNTIWDGGNTAPINCWYQLEYSLDKIDMYLKYSWYVTEMYLKHSWYVSEI